MDQISICYLDRNNVVLQHKFVFIFFWFTSQEISDCLFWYLYMIAKRLPSISLDNIKYFDQFSNSSRQQNKKLFVIVFQKYIYVDYKFALIKQVNGICEAPVGSMNHDL